MGRWDFMARGNCWLAVDMGMAFLGYWDRYGLGDAWRLALMTDVMLSLILCVSVALSFSNLQVSESKARVTL
jgi:hypothetical protein